MQHLAQVTQRMYRPKLAASMSAWRFDFEAARHAAIAEGQALLLTQETRGRGTAEEELRAAQKALQAERTSTSHSLGEAGERAERLAAQLEAEREKRVAHLQRIAASRIALHAVARGWSSWLALFEE